MRRRARWSGIPTHTAVTGILLLGNGAALGAQDDARYGELPVATAAKYGKRVEGMKSLPGSRATMVEKGVAWLLAQQSGDGSREPGRFGGRPDTVLGVTGLCALALLAEDGLRPGSELQEPLRRALDWIAGEQLRVEGQPEDGRIGSDSVRDVIYGHCIGALALVEASGLGAPDLAEAAQAAVGYIERYRGQGPGWRYFFQDNDADTSVTSWAAQVLVAARDFGLEVDEEQFEAIELWMRSVTDEATGLVGYTSVEGGSSRIPGDHVERFPIIRNPTLCAVALAVRLQLGKRSSAEGVLVRQMDLLDSFPPLWDEAGSIDVYYWYYGSMAAALEGGAFGEEWSDAVEKALSKGQRADGSWPAEGVWGSVGGEIYTTALSVLSLQAPYRYLPVQRLSLLPEDRRFRSLRRAWDRGEFRRIPKMLEKVDRDGLEGADKVRFEWFAKRFETWSADLSKDCKSLLSQGNFVESELLLKDLAKSWKGTSVGDAAETQLQRLKGDSTLKTELVAAKIWRGLRRQYYGLWRDQGKASKLLGPLEEFVVKYAGTRAEGLASARLPIVKAWAEREER